MSADRHSDIAIVGLDCRFPHTPDPAALWELLMGGGDVISEVPANRWNADEFHDPAGAPGTINARSGGFLDDADAFDHEFFGIAPREAEAMDPQQRLLLQTAWRAFEDATLDPRAQAGSRTGVYVGVMANEWANLQMSDYAAITAQHGSGNGYFMTANRLSYQLDLKGPSMAVDTACSSSLVAIHLACAALASGECDQALAGGVNLVLTPAVGIFYTQAGLSAPDARCKPFSADADGIVRGEGVAVLVLRRLADAEAEGLPIYAVIKGSAVNSDGRSNGITAPNRWAQQQVVEQAYQRAGVRPQEVDFVEAHGTGTVLGDMIEVKALGKLHSSDRAQPCGIGSIKGNLGHTEGAAGVAGLIKVALGLHHGVVPPSRFADTANPKLRMAQHGLRLLAEPMPLPERAMGGVSSFGVGGTNAHIVLASAPAGARVGVRDGLRTVLVPGSGTADRLGNGLGGVLTLSSDNAAGLRRNALRMAGALAAVPGDEFAQLCWTSNQVKASGRSRIAIVAADRDDAIAQLRGGAEAGIAQPVTAGWMFSGQGSQFSGMGRALHAASRGFGRALGMVDEAMAPHLGRSVRELLLDDQINIDSTELAQPAIFAMEYALAQSLAELGLRPAWLVGHSIGEYAAAAVAGVFDLDDACRLVVARGALMRQLPEGGAMLAVRADTAAVADLLAAEPEVAIAAANSPADLVLSGDATAIARIKAELDARALITKPLAVSHAFHSPLMSPMLAEFEAAARTCTYRAPSLPIYSTVRGRLLEPGETMDAAYWTEHISATVRFGEAIDAALATTPTHIVEVGPRKVLTPLVGRIRPESATRCLAPSPGPGATGRELSDVVAALYRDGFDPDWGELYDPEQRVRLRLPTYEFSTEHRFWLEPRAGVNSPVPPGTGTATNSPAHHELRTPTTSPAQPEDTTMDQMIALFREQNALLARLAHAHADSPAPSPMAGVAVGAPLSGVPGPGVSAPVVGTVVEQGDGVAHAAGIVHTEAARVTGYLADRLRESQTLSGDLGFDSIMTADLFTGITRRIPGLIIDPARFGEHSTLGDVVGYVADRGARAGNRGADSRVQHVSPGATLRNHASPRDAALTVTTTERESAGIVPGSGVGVVKPAPGTAVMTPNPESTPMTPDPAPAVTVPDPEPTTMTSDLVPVPPLVEPEYSISDFAEVKAIEGRLAGAESLGLSNPYFLVNDGVTRDTSVIDGRPVVNFSSYNYLGLSGHPAVVDAVQDAVARYGSSCSASRVLSGEKPVHRELEAELAALLGTDDAMALVGGHSTNVTIIGHIVGPSDLVIHDSLAHDSILQGCKLSGATRRPFPHNDHAALDQLLTELRPRYRRVLILIEGVYSQDGDIPDLPAIIEIKKRHQAMLMIDEAHSIGVLGAGGGGIGEHFDVDRRDVELWSGTMSKALAGCGGYVAGSAELIRFLKYTTPGFVYSVGMTPMNAAASAEAIRQLRTDPEPLERLRRNSQLFLTLAREAGIDTGDSHDTPIVPCIVGDSLKTLKLSNALLRRGVNVNPILYPAVPEDLARLRFFVTACHSEQQIRETVAILAEEMALL
ncbi:aminotransferase class I/II-fold pyridoxal phosphate-dependent enzyme [Nocardia sp. NPDC059180]|uniref:aminotransferase class I/II-fold pyridoxal phosphate-dependent enzyme n=1 Tax=Nocardia sp. NPDC059180 TaxID=3346761 RepID=UPI00369564E2